MCLPQSLVQCFLDFFNQPFVYPPHHGDLERLNCQLISCSARKSCNLLLLRVLLIHVVVVLNVAALSEIIHSGLFFHVVKGV